MTIEVKDGMAENSENVAMAGHKHDEPLISVIVPVYNVERYLDQCVRSILEQTHRNIELVLVDDGSKDSSGMMCDEFAVKDARVHVIHQENAGQAVARNVGIDHAHGDYVGFVDSDDWLAPDMYESMLRNMQKTGADLAFTASQSVYPNNEIVDYYVKDQFMVLTSGEAFQYINLAGYFGVAPWDKLIARNVLSDVRFPVGYFQGEDYLFSYKVIDNASRIVFDSTPKYFYRQTVSSVSNTSREVSVAASDATAWMLELLESEYPEALPYGRLGHIKAMLGVYDQAVRSGQYNGPKAAYWKQYERNMRDFIAANEKSIISVVNVPKGRRTQMNLVRYCPGLYRMAFRLYKKLNNRRAE